MNEPKAQVTYDQVTLSSAEIVAPSINKDVSDLPLRALREGMAKAETRDAILAVTGGAMEIEEAQAGVILNAAATVLKAQREAKKSKALQAATNDVKRELNSITCDMLNKMNNDYYWGAK